MAAYLRKAKKQIYFHLTDRRDWGPEIKIFPRSTGKNRPDEEPNVSRICVSLSISGCLAALYSCVDLFSLQIYATKYPTTAYYPIAVPDSGVTKERWIVHPCIFVRKARKIPRQAIDEIHDDFNEYFCCGDPEYLSIQKRAYKHIDKVLRKYLDPSLFN